MKDSFEYFKNNCKNFKETEWSGSIKTSWRYRCSNFEKDKPNLNNTCYNCKYLNVKKKSN